MLGVALVALVLVGAAWRWGLAGFVQRFSDQAEKKSPPGATAKEVTLVLTDVQVSAGSPQQCAGCLLICCLGSACRCQSQQRDDNTPETWAARSEFGCSPAILAILHQLWLHAPGAEHALLCIEQTHLHCMHAGFH